MTDTASDLARRESRAARRLARLFRIERGGGFARRPPETAQRLIARRGVLVEELIHLEAQRRSFAPWVPTELGLAMEVLARDVERSRGDTVARIERLTAELRRRRGGGLATGLRDGGGQLLGHG